MGFKRKFEMVVEDIRQDSSSLTFAFYFFLLWTDGLVAYLVILKVQKAPQWSTQVSQKIRVTERTQG